MSHLRRALILTLAGLVAMAAIACSSSPAAPTAPTVSIPAIPTVSIPAIPTVSIPAIPSVSLPVIPSVSIPALPSGFPSISIPAIPSDLPSFSIPAIPTFHQAQDLEGALPSQIRGVTLEKSSFSGAFFLSSGSNEELTALLNQFGKQPSDLSVAGANDPNFNSDTRLSFQLIVFRLAGVDANQLLAAFLTSGGANGGQTPTSVTRGNVGGKDVTITTDDKGVKSYIYTRDDKLFLVTSDADDADALCAEILAAIP
jgi:hypothetical protein